MNGEDGRFGKPRRKTQLLIRKVGLALQRGLPQHLWDGGRHLGPASDMQHVQMDLTVKASVAQAAWEE